jgi:hypothetical protein
MASTVTPAPYGTFARSWNAIYRGARTHPYTLLGVVLALALAGPFLFRKDSEWDEVYIRAAINLLAGENIFATKDPYAYPPFMTLLALPFAFLPQVASRALWYLVNIACLVVICRCAWQVAGGARLQGAGKTSKSEHFACILGLLCALRYSVDVVAHQQNDLLVGALVLAGCWALHRARVWSAAVYFGLGAAIKCTPLLWLPYLLWRGHWKQAGLLLGVALGANLLLELIQGPPGGGLWLKQFYSLYLVPLASSRYPPGLWLSDIVYNQSLSGLANRWLMTVAHLRSAGFAVTPAENPVSVRTLKLLVYGAEALLLLGAVWSMGWRRAGKDQPVARRAPLPSALECSAVLLLMVLLSPMSSKPHFCILLLPAFCLARLGICHRDRASLFFLLAACVATALSMRDLVGNRFSMFMLWCGAVTWCALFLLTGCLVGLWRRPAVAAGAGQDAPASDSALAA